MKKYVLLVIFTVTLVFCIFFYSLQKPTLQVEGIKEFTVAKPVVWKTYNIKGSQYRLDYPADFSFTEDKSPNISVRFENFDKTITIWVSNEATGWGEDWKECAPHDNGIVIDSSVNILYLCNEGSYRILATNVGSKFYIVAAVPEKEFYSPEMRSIFRQMVSSWTVQ